MTADEPWQGAKEERAWDLSSDPKPASFFSLTWLLTPGF